MDDMEENFEKNYYSILKDNLDLIYKNLSDVFKISFEEFKIIIIDSMRKLNTPFFREALENKNLLQCYSINSLQNIIESFKSVNIDEKQMKQIIIQYPEILVFSNMPENIKYLFKLNDLKAIVLIYNDQYNYHLFDENFIKNFNYNIIKRLSIEDRENPYYLNNDGIYNSKLNYFEGLLKTLDRKDVREYYGLDKESKLLDKVNALEEDFNKREIYIKKKRNTNK